MKHFFLTVAGVFFGMILFILFFVVLVPVMIGLALSGASGPQRAPLGDSVVVEVDLRSTMLDQPGSAPLSLGAPALLDFVRAMAAVETDDRVRGVFIRANEAGLEAAQAQEIRDAILGVRAAGKFVIAHSQGFESTSVLPYLAISAADEVWLQQTANFAASGVSTETMFLGGVLEKYGAESQILQIAEYKTAANSYNEAGYTPEHAESLNSLLTSIYDTSVALVGEDRGLTPQEVRAAFDAAPYNAEDAARAGLIDRVGHVIDAHEAAEARAADAGFVPFGDYLSAMDNPWDEGPVIALITGQGEIMTGESWGQGNILSGTEVIGSDTVAEALMDAAEDDAVQAILFRVDSPGGSVVASEQIWDAMRRAREAGKPIVVSMGPLAASGGYYIATPADTIVAQPGTLTGSIGIYGGKLVLDGALDLVGLNIEPMSVGGPFSGAYTSQLPFTPQQEAAVQAMLQDGYDTFTAHVAEGRAIAPERVQEIARGRVWSGQQAFDIGLVDELGGFRDAVAAAREIAGIEADAPVTLRRYPARPALLEQLRALFGASAESNVLGALGTLIHIAGTPQGQAAIRALQAAEAPQGALADTPSLR